MYTMFPATRDGQFPTGRIQSWNRDRQRETVPEAGSSLKRALLLVRRRTISSIPVLLIVIVGAFLLLEAAPGDAVDAYLLSIGGGDPSLVQSLRESYGLDRSSLSRLWLYVGALFRLDLGWSVIF